MPFTNAVLKYSILTLLLTLTATTSNANIETIIHLIDEPRSNNEEHARILAKQQAVQGDELGYHSTSGKDRQTFHGIYTPPELSDDLKGQYIYKLAIFSDDGCDVTVGENLLHNRHGKGQALPKLGQSFYPLNVTVTPGKPVKLKVDYSNTHYIPKPNEPDIDGCTLFVYLEPVKTCFVKKTWSDPLLSLPTNWVEPFRADIKQQISDSISVDLGVAREMLRRLRLDIQIELRRSDLPNRVVDQLNKMLTEVEALINDSSKKIEIKATELAQSAAGFVADSMLNAWLGLDFIADKGPVPAVTAEYSWQDGAFKSGNWKLLTSSTEITGLKQVKVSGKGNAKLSTSLGIALGVAAEVETPAIVEISGSVGGTLEGKEVASVVTSENVISFEPRYALTISISAGLEAGWGIQLAGGLEFDYQLPLATPNSTDTAFSLGDQSLTSDENDKNKKCK